MVYEDSDATDPDLTTPFVEAGPVPGESDASDFEPTRRLVPAHAAAPSEDELTRPLPTAGRARSEPPVPPRVTGARIIAVSASRTPESGKPPVSVAFPPQRDGKVESAPSIQVAPQALRRNSPPPSIRPEEGPGIRRGQSPTLPPQQLPLRVNTISVPPVAGSIAPEAPGRPGIRNLAMLAALVAVVMVFAVVLRLRPGTLVMTASSALGEAPGKVQFFVDGAERCRETPCRIDRLSPGAHLVGVMASGYAPFAERAIVIEPGQPAAQHLTLTADTPVVPERAPAEAPAAVLDPPAPPPPPSDAERPAPAPAAPVQELFPATRPPPTRTVHAAARRARSSSTVAAQPVVSAQSTSQMAMLDLSSTPPSPVVVNGRPLGMSPIHVSVAPGHQSIIFVHPELGRKAIGVDVVGGAHRSVAVTY